MMSQNLSRSARPNRRAAGFTLVEIMMVIFISGVLLNMAEPAFVHARDVGQCRACVANLHNIDLAKEQYAFENNSGNSFTPQWSDLEPYVNSNGTEPLCPTTGQVYVFNPISELPTCPYGGPAGLPHDLQ